MVKFLANLVAVMTPTWTWTQFSFGSMLLALTAFFGGHVPACADEPPRPARSGQIDGNISRAAVTSLQQYLALDPSMRGRLEEHVPANVPLTRSDAKEAESLLWTDHAQMIRQTREAEIKERRLQDGDLLMPFHYEVFGEKPDSGRSLFISLHGGGGAPKQVNDQQWENQKHLYRPEEGVYVAPRAPTDAWDLWHQPLIDRLFARLIEDLVVFEDVDPNRVFLMGYSAGGDGVYKLAPRMADRWAAAAMMAGHPNGVSPLGLRNIAFTIHVGANDAAYDRNKVAVQWERDLTKLHASDPEGYTHLVKIYPGKGHWLDREDSAAVPWMAKFTRNPLPKRVVWKQDGVTHRRFYWLAVDSDQPRTGTEIIADLDGQRIDVKAEGHVRLIVRLNDQMLDLDRPIVITAAGKEVFRGIAPRTIGTLARTLGEYGDPKGVFTSEVPVEW